jgi:hypothetical protein
MPAGRLLVIASKRYAANKMKKMNRQSLTIAFTLILFQTVFGQNEKFFPNLNYVSIDTTYNVDFGFNPKTTRLINEPCYLLDKGSPFFCEKDSIFVDWVLVGKFKNENIKDSLNILYSQGMSADPGFEISKENGERVTGFSCLDFYINESGTIYTSGHTNSMYDKRRKFQIQEDTIIEIQQPFRYVGIKGQTLKPITLYEEKTGESVVAHLQKNYEIEILLTESSAKDFEIEYNYLVKTEFGLIGWLRLTYEDTYGKVLEELFYAGD